MCVSRSERTIMLTALRTAISGCDSEDASYLLRAIRTCGSKRCDLHFAIHGHLGSQQVLASMCAAPGSDITGLDVARGWLGANWGPERRDELLTLSLPLPLAVACACNRWHWVALAGSSTRHRGRLFPDWPPAEVLRRQERQYVGPQVEGLTYPRSSVLALRRGPGLHCQTANRNRARGQRRCAERALNLA